MPTKVTIKYPVDIGYCNGDCCYLYTNGGSGDIDYDNPVSGRLPLFRNRGGIFGFGHAPFGHGRFGKPFASRCGGFGHLPFGCGPFGLGTGIVEAVYYAAVCGDYKFAFKVFDAAGNATDGSGQQELETEVHVRPARPDPLTAASYTPETNVLTLNL